MHQQEEGSKPTKTIIGFDTVVSSASRMIGGTGTYHDLVTIATTLKFCEDKLKVNPRLGFSKEIQSIHKTISCIVTKVGREDVPTEQTWQAPFLLISEQRDLQALIFLVRNQFISTPMLDPRIPLEQHFEDATEIQKDQL